LSILYKNTSGNLSFVQELKLLIIHSFILQDCAAWSFQFKKKQQQKQQQKLGSVIG